MGPGHLDQGVLKMIQKEFPFLFEENKSNFDVNDPNPLVELLKDQGVKHAFLINYESTRVMGYGFEINNWSVNFCEQSDGFLIPVGGVEPFNHNNSGSLIKDYLETSQIKMVKVHGPHQLLSPNEYTKGNNSLASLYEICEATKTPILFHTGSSIFPKARSRYGNPLDIEDVLIDYPTIKVVLAHGGRPFWTKEFEYLMRKFPKIHFDLSGVPPTKLIEYFPRIDRFIDRCIFGSDFPSPGVPSILQNAISFYRIFQSMNLSDQSISQIFKENALSLIK